MDLGNIGLLDDAAAETGTWVKLPGLGDLEVKLRKYDCLLAATARIDFTIENGAILAEGGTTRTKAWDEFGIELLRDVIVLDWRNFVENGEPLECTKENVERVVRQYDIVRVAIEQQSQRRANFHMKENSKPGKH